MTACERVAKSNLVADANILIAAEKGRLLQKLGGLRLCTTTIVAHDELLGKRTFGNDALDKLRLAGIEVVETKVDASLSRSLAGGLSLADRTCMSLAVERDGTVLTHDEDLIRACEVIGVSVRGMEWLMTVALDAGHLSASDCLAAFRLWRADPTEGSWYERPEMLAIEERCKSAV